MPSLRQEKKMVKEGCLAVLADPTASESLKIAAQTILDSINEDKGWRGWLPSNHPNRRRHERGRRIRGRLG